MVVAEPNHLVLVSGPSRGGKSRWAEHLISQEPSVTYLATSESRPNDHSWQQRIDIHRQRRPEHWRLVECGADLASALNQTDPEHSLLIDSLGGFVASNLESTDHEWTDICESLCNSLQQRNRPVVIVIEETGWGVVPATAVGGLFRDRLGWLAQELERRSRQSWLVVQGRALDLHRFGVKVP